MKKNKPLKYKDAKGNSKEGVITNDDYIIYHRERSHDYILDLKKQGYIYPKVLIREYTNYFNAPTIRLESVIRIEREGKYYLVLIKKETALDQQKDGIAFFNSAYDQFMIEVYRIMHLYKPCGYELLDPNQISEEERLRKDMPK